MSKTYELKLDWCGDHQSYIIFRAHLDEMTDGQYVEIEDGVNLDSVENEHTNPADTKPLGISVYRSAKEELLELEKQLKQKFEPKLNREWLLARVNTKPQGFACKQ